ncbi:hypothetical protein INT43_001727 [Umbelopsis isabellina]|uniref:Uncharacterized protein n=1 Tax=Mortierella isabellina TaxID=91625 RepID=A0A8H7UAY9_MORIS|nr:hypothetical protein INT43_001727 [Umbelopsis isabellina]
MASSQAGGNPAMTEATDTFQFTFSVPVPKFSNSNYHSHHRPEPSSDNSTPDSGSSHLLFSLNPDNNDDGEGSDESDVGDDENEQGVESPSNHHDKTIHERVVATYQSEASVQQQPMIRRLRTRTVVVSDELSTSHKQASNSVPQGRSTSVPPKSRKRKTTLETQDMESHAIAHTTQLKTTKHKLEIRAHTDDTPRPRKTRRSYTSADMNELDLPSYGSRKSQANHETDHRNQTDIEDSVDQSCLQFRSGYDYFGVSDEENEEEHGYHGADEQEGIGHILDAAEALKMMKQRRQDRTDQKKPIPSKASQVKPRQHSPDDAPASPVPIRKRQPGIVIPTSQSQEDFVYVDSECEEPPAPQKLPIDDDEGRKLVYVFRGQKYQTDVDLTDIPWAAGDSDDDEDLQQIRFKPRVLWPDHPQDVNSRIKLKDTQANK